MLTPLLSDLQFTDPVQSLPQVDCFLPVSPNTTLVECSICSSLPSNSMESSININPHTPWTDWLFLFCYSSTWKWIVLNPECFVEIKGQVFIPWPQNFLGCGSEPLAYIGLKSGAERGIQYSCPKAVKLQSLCAAWVLWLVHTTLHLAHCLVFGGGGSPCLNQTSF